MQPNNLIQATYGVKERLFHSPVRVRAGLHCIRILLHICRCKAEEWHEEVRFVLTTFRCLILENELQQLHCCDFRHVNSFHHVCLLSNVLDWILIKQLLVTRGDKHKRNDGLVQNAVHERQHFVHR